MPTTLLFGETWDQAYARRFREDAATIATTYGDHIAASLSRHMDELDRRDAYEAEINRRVDAILDYPDMDDLQEHMSAREIAAMRRTFGTIANAHLAPSINEAVQELRTILQLAASRQAAHECRQERRP